MCAGAFTTICGGKGLCDHGFNGVNDRRREKSHQNGVKGKGPDGFTQIEFVIFALQGNNNQTADHQAAQMKEGECGLRAGAELGKTECCRGQDNETDQKSCLHVFFHDSVPPFLPLLRFSVFYYEISMQKEQYQDNILYLYEFI